MRFSSLYFLISSSFSTAFLPADIGNCPNLDASATFFASHVDIAPSPIVVGGKVTVNLKGSLKEPITEGATYKVVLKLGSVTIFTERHNFCENTACPVLPSDATQIVVHQDVPQNAPPGKFTMVTTLSNADGSVISCITGPVQLVKSA